MRIGVVNTYSCSTQDTVELPEGKTWDDIADFYVKWGFFHYRLKGADDYNEIELGNDISDAIDWKRPSDTQVYACNDEGEIDFDVELPQPDEAAA